MITLATHIGPRDENADAIGAIALKGCTVTVVCDGVGFRGKPAAEAAVAAVLAETKRRARALAGAKWSTVDGVLHGAIERATVEVERLPGRSHTTMLVAVVWTGRLAVAHTGDSRVWMSSFGALRPLVQPHGLGRIVRSTVPSTRQIDICHVDIDPDLLGEGLLVLASDGLDEPRGETAAEMVAAQIKAGAKDNVTAAVIPFYERSLDREIGPLVTL